MKRVEHSARIAAPPDALFAYLADLDKLDEWMAGIVSAEVDVARRARCRYNGARGPRSAASRRRLRSPSPNTTRRGISVITSEVSA